jgi:HEAT repeat protein
VQEQVMTDNTQALVDALRREPDATQQVKLIKEIGRQRISTALDVLADLSQIGGLQSGPAIEAMGDIGDPRATKILVRSLAEQNLAWIAKDALVKIGAATVEALIAALDDGNPDVRFGAVRTLAELLDPRAIVPLEQFVAHEDDATNRQLARTTLKALLLEALVHDDAAIRLGAVQGLARLNDARTIEALRPLAERDPDDAVRRAAQETIETLLKGVNDDPFVEHDVPLACRTTRLAINTLSRQIKRPIPLPDTPDKAALSFTALREIVAENSTDAALQDQAQTCMYSLALDCLRDPDPAARVLAVQALIDLGDPGATQRVQQIAAHDPDAEVRRAAQR